MESIARSDIGERDELKTHSPQHYCFAMVKRAAKPHHKHPKTFWKHAIVGHMVINPENT